MGKEYKMKIDESYLARRRFLCGMLGGGAAALGTSVVVPLTYYAGNFREERLPPFAKIPKADYDLRPGESTLVKYGPMKVLLLKTPPPNSELKVLDATCTHLDCIVRYEASENYIICECHMGKYDVDGHVISGPPPEDLAVFHKEFQGDQLVIALKRENLEKALEESDG